jgi:carbamoyl-phosphate synthase large subunit
MAESSTGAKKLNVLFTTVGRRVSLLNSFRRAAVQLKISAQFFGTDINELAPALQFCDRRLFVKPINDRAHIPGLLKIVDKNKIKLLVPTIDTNLLVLAQNRKKFAALGCCVLVSEPHVVHICQDKREAYHFMIKNGFDTPTTMSVRSALAKRNLHWPVLLKPWDGSASRGVTVVNNRQELAVFNRLTPNCIVQEFVEGTEYTCDVYIDFNMNVRCVVPRKRIEVRGGEVSKGQVVKDKAIINRVAEFAKVLEAGPGVITVQCFLQPDGKILFTDINPRFGGGVPLAIKAGANFPKWILQELLGRKPRIRFDGFDDSLIMLRYDAEVWLNGSDIKS